jgi:hypothetical protein
MRARLRITLVVVLLLLGLTGCRKRKPVPLPFKPPQSRPAVIETPEIAPPPELSATAGHPSATLPAGLALPPLAAPPKPRPAIAAPPVQPQAPPPVLPELRPILTAAETRDLERAINARIARARSLLRSIEGKRKSGPQTVVVDQIRTFIRQAEEARKTDLLRANNLAERAEVLASDLAQQLR